MGRIKISILFLFISLAAFSQKVKLKDDKVLVDGQEYLKYEGGGMLDNSMTAYALDGEELIYMQVVNPGPEWYAKIVFIGLKEKTLEMSSNNFTRKKFFELLYKNKVVYNINQMK